MRFHKLLREEVEGQLHGSYACTPIADGRPDTTDAAPACPHLAQQDFLGLLGRNNMEEEDVRRLLRRCLLKTTP